MEKNGPQQEYSLQFLQSVLLWKIKAYEPCREAGNRLITRRSLPSKKEIAERMGVSLDELRRIIRNAHVAWIARWWLYDPLMSQNLHSMWHDYRTTGSKQLRDVILKHYQPLVRSNARRLVAKLSVEVDLDDLISAGYYGLLDAIEAFDPDSSIKFETYCAPRIRGAILDEIRSMDWVPRLVRARVRKFDDTRKDLRTELGRDPSDKEIAKRMGISMKGLKKYVRDAHAVSQVSFNRKWFGSDISEQAKEVDLFKDYVQLADRQDIKSLIAQGFSCTESLFITLYYYEGMTIEKIGTFLHLSEAGVSEIHKSTLRRLKQQLGDRRKDGDKGSSD